MFRMIFILTFTKYRIGCKLTDCSLMFQSLLIGSWQKLQNRSASVLINGKPRSSITNSCYLGVLIDQDLSWKSHVDNVLKRIRCKLYALYHLKPMPSHLLFWLYLGFLPVFDYCGVVWAPHYSITFKAVGMFVPSFLTSSKLQLFC